MSSVLLIPGSLRKDSYNRRLLSQLAAQLPLEWSVEELDPISVRLPLFNQDLETDPASLEQAHTLHACIDRAQGFIVASPEYNGQITAYLKNLVDWVSRLPYIDEGCINAFLDKPVLLCSASTGPTGGAVGIGSARDLFAYVGAQVIGGAICVSDVASKWNGREIEMSQQAQAVTDFHMHRFIHALMIRSAGAL